jgi:ribosome-binding factor A
LGIVFRRIRFPRQFHHPFGIGIQVILGMTTRRTARVNRAIQEAVSTAVLFKVKDPRVKNVTVLRAEASDDLRAAKVYVSVMGDEKRQALTMNGLAAARGFLQSKVADRLQTKQTPILTFVLDQTVKQNAAAQAALSHLFPVPEGGAPDEAGNAESDGDESLGLDAEGFDSDGMDSEDWEADDDTDDELGIEDLETDDLSAIDGAGAADAAMKNEVHNSPSQSSTTDGQIVPSADVRRDVNVVNESEPAVLEENKDLRSH